MRISANQQLLNDILANQTFTPEQVHSIFDDSADSTIRLGHIAETALELDKISSEDYQKLNEFFVYIMSDISDFLIIDLTQEIRDGGNLGFNEWVGETEYSLDASQANKLEVLLQIHNLWSEVIAGHMPEFYEENPENENKMYTDYLTKSVKKDYWHQIILDIHEETMKFFSQHVK